MRKIFRKKKKKIWSSVVSNEKCEGWSTARSSASAATKTEENFGKVKISHICFHGEVRFLH